MDKVYETQTKRNKKIGILIGCILLGVMICSASVFATCPSVQFKWYLGKDDCFHAASIYNNSFVETEEEEKYAELFLDYISETKARWKESKLDYKKAVVNLENLQEVEHKEVSAEAKWLAAYIEREGYGNECYEKAAAYAEKEEYIKAMKELKSIDEDYIRYADVLKLNDACKEAILDQTENLQSVNDLENWIRKLDSYFKVVEEPAFATRKAQLEKELAELKEIIDLVKTVSDVYDSGNYKEAFRLLEDGLVRYPDHPKMEEGYQLYLERYVEMIATEVKEACEAEEYRKALEIVEEALEVHDCDPLRNIQEYVKEEKNILYRWKNKFIDFWEKFM